MRAPFWFFMKPYKHPGDRWNGREILGFYGVVLCFLLGFLSPGLCVIALVGLIFAIGFAEGRP